MGVGAVARRLGGRVQLGRGGGALLDRGAHARVDELLGALGRGPAGGDAREEHRLHHLVELGLRDYLE